MTKPTREAEFISTLLAGRDIPGRIGRDWQDIILADILWEIMELKRALAETHGWKQDDE